MDIDTDGKFYRTVRDNFMWKSGAILEFSSDYGDEGGYIPLNELDAWNATAFNRGTDKSADHEYISAPIVENNINWFEQVYPVKKTEKEGDVGFANTEETTKKYNLEFESINVK